jgi:hypothetical protein
MNANSVQLMHDLADKCKSQYVNHNGPWMDYIKFAELIVKECIESIEKTIDTDCDGDSEKMGCDFAITNLKQHFGIKMESVL